mmetsp:Transcript_31159/g.89416  ORF Transcript_31159/g.89416 Transcript_31159/m.89416 type:complete len:225 (-) Transcript_31159:1011-1685(-)
MDNRCVFVSFAAAHNFDSTSGCSGRNTNAAASMDWRGAAPAGAVGSSNAPWNVAWSWRSFGKVILEGSPFNPGPCMVKSPCWKQMTSSRCIRGKYTQFSLSASTVRFIRFCLRGYPLKLISASMISESCSELLSSTARWWFSIGASATFRQSFRKTTRRFLLAAGAPSAWSSGMAALNCCRKASALTSVWATPRAGGWKAASSPSSLARRSGLGTRRLALATKS